MCLPKSIYRVRKNSRKKNAEVGEAAQWVGACLELLAIPISYIKVEEGTTPQNCPLSITYCCGTHAPIQLHFPHIIIILKRNRDAILYVFCFI